MMTFKANEIPFRQLTTRLGVEFSYTPSFIGKGIAAFQGMVHPAGRPFRKKLPSHVYMDYADTPVGMTIYHSTWPRTCISHRAQWRRDVEAAGGWWAHLEFEVDLTAADRLLIHGHAVKNVGLFYSFPEIALQAPDLALGWVGRKLFGTKYPPVVFRRLNRVLPNTVCSHLIADLLMKLGNLPEDSRNRAAFPSWLLLLLLDDGGWTVTESWGIGANEGELRLRAGVGK